MANKKEQETKSLGKKYIGKVGLISFGGLTIEVKVIDYRKLGREQVLLVPVGKTGRGQIWKYLNSVEFQNN